MRNRQPTARRPNSPAKHVFSAAKAHEIPLPAAWPNRTQATDTQWIFAVEKALLRGRNAFFPCRQGKIAMGSSHGPSPPCGVVIPSAKIVSERSPLPSVLRRQLIGLEHQPSDPPA